MFVFHHWDDRDPGVNTAYYEFCEDGQVTAHYQLLSSGSPPRALHINIAYVDLPGAAFPDLPVPARVDPPDYYGIASRSTAYGGADFLYLGRLPSVVVTVPHAVQTGEGQIRPFDHWEGLSGAYLYAPEENTVSLTLSQNVEITAVYGSPIAPAAAVLREETSFATAMVPGRWYEATVTMKNTGADTWTKADGYGLVCRETPSDLWTTTSVPLADGDVIAPGQEKTFHFLMRAPQQLGCFLPHWSMGIGDTVPFGDITNQEVPITGEGRCICLPTFSDQEVIYCGGWCSPGQLYGYDLETKTTVQLTPGDTTDFYPEISGDRVAYTSQFPDGHWAVSVLDLATGAIQHFDANGSPSPPDIEGDYVVWTSTDVSLQTHLILLDLSAGQSLELDQDARFPRIDGGRIAYVKTSANLLCVYDIAQGRITQELPCAGIELGPPGDWVGGQFPWTGSEVDISGDQVAAICDGQVVLFDLAAGTRTQLTHAVSPKAHPRISDGRIVWSDGRTTNWDGVTNWDVFLYDTATATELRLTTDPNSDRNPVIEGSRVVWNRCWGPPLYLLDGPKGVSVTGDAGTGFPDVPADHWAYDEIMDCSKANIVGGYDDSLYHPEFSVTRDQMAAYIARALVSPSGDAAIADPGPPPSFSDVPPTHWAYKHIEYAVSQNVVKGYDDGTYQPGLTVDRGQMAVYVARAMVAPGGDAAIPDPVPPATFPDVASTFWAYKHIEYCVGHGVVTGYDDGKYHPEYPCTRDQMAVYIARAFGLM
jgi:hypothetical protein